MVTNSNYHQKDVEVEKGTIHAEVLNCHNDHWNTLAETSHFVSFRNNVIGLPILGLVENIPKMSSEMVKQYHRDNYHGDNVQIVCAGGVDHKEIVALCERSFKNLPKTPAHRKNYEPAPAIFTPGRMWIVQPSQGDRVYSILNMQGPGYTSPDYLGFMLLNNIIGESDLSAGFLSSLPKAEAFKAVGPKVNLLRNFSKYKACYLPYHEVGLFTLFLDSPVEDAGSAERLLKAYLQDLLFNVSYGVMVD
jgi:predicted Zn-dependent peptidase